MDPRIAAAKDPRISAVVPDLVSAIRSVMMRHKVTFKEYRDTLAFLQRTEKAGEAMLLTDVLFSTTVADIEAETIGGTKGTVQGPYHLNDAPWITDGKLKTYEDDSGTPIIIRGQVLDLDGRPLPGAVVDIWHSTPDGLYGGFHKGPDLDHYRGRILTDAQGRYNVRSTEPVPYEVPNTGPDAGPAGELLTKMGRHSWRPAHVHIKIDANGFHSHTTQIYFEGGEYLEDDCVEGVREHLIAPGKMENGVKVMENKFHLAPVAGASIAA